MFALPLHGNILGFFYLANQIHLQIFSIVCCLFMFISTEFNIVKCVTKTSSSTILVGTKHRKSPRQLTYLILYPGAWKKHSNIENKFNQSQTILGNGFQ